MAHIAPDRVREFSTSTGTGNFTLTGAVTSFRAFSSVASVNDTFYYTIAALGLNEWEVGIGTYVSTNTISRNTIIASSNAGSAVNFSTGDKDVFITAPGSKFLQMDNTGSYGNFTAGTITASLSGNASTVTNGVYTSRTISTTSPLSGGGDLSANRTLSLASGYGDTQNPYASKTANYVLAAPNGAAGVPTFRAIVAADIPTLNQNTTGSAATLTTARTLTIGSTGKTFDGSANVSWSLSEIGVGAGTLTLGIGTAGATNTTVTIGTGTGYNANTGTNTTYDIKVGPALTNLATLMTTAGAGFIKRGATADTYTIDTNTYLTAEADTLATVTGRGASTTTAISLAGGTNGTTAGSQVKMLTFGAANSNSSYLEIAETRQNAGTTWNGSGGSGWRLQQKVDSTWMGYIQFNGNGNDGGISMGTGTTTTSATTISERWRLDSSGNMSITGNVAIGNSSAWSKLWVERNGIDITALSYEDASSTAHLTLAGADSHVRLHLGTTNSGSFGGYIQATYDNTPDNSGTGSSGIEPLLLNPRGGQVVIGATDKFATASVALYVKGGTSGWSIFERNNKRIYINANYADTNTAAQISSEASSSMALSLSARETLADLYLTTGGNVGVGTTSPAYKLEVNGSFAATTKSFVIDHPTKPGKRLRYGSLEGPENGVYVRGRLKGKVIELPDYWIKLVDPDSITVQLTPIGKHQKLYVEDIRDNKVYIANDGLFAGEINCFYYVLAERCDVEKLEVEIG